DFTMNPSINCSSSFADVTRDVILASRNGNSCFDFTAAINDAFANRITINNLPAKITADSRGATTESNESNLDETGATLWWELTAPATGIIRVDLEGSDFDTQLQIYELGESGTVSDLKPVAANDDEQSTLQSDVSFPAIGGRQYLIRVGGFTVNGFSRVGNIAMCVQFTPEGPAEFFWSTATLDMGAINTSNGLADIEAGSFGSLFLYFDPLVTDIDTGAFFDVAASDDGIIEFTSAETLEFDISVTGTPVGVRWGDGVGATGEVQPLLIDELGAANVVSGSGMLVANTGPVFFDQGFDFGVGAFLFARIDFGVVGEPGDDVNIITTRGATQIVHNEMSLDPFLGSFTLNVIEARNLIGDVNCDGVVDLLDVGPFVDLLTSGGFSEKADINADGIVDLLDVGPFVALLSGG
ncbi:MAG: hypothetical protein AAGA30_09115, partial [Planctomycetota bacterium]